jgi:cysteinyl-tRNA synthetase
VHYFLHTGHLHIEGRKMSKSLKNFLTIREVLHQVTPRQLRLLFLMQSWRDPMNYSQGTVTEMLAKEKTIREFMLMVKTRVRDDMASQHSVGQRWNSDDEEVHKAILETEKKVSFCAAPYALGHTDCVQVHLALCEDVNTPLVLRSLEALILTCNKYIMATAARQSALAKAAAADASAEFPEWELSAFKELGPQKPKLLLLKRAASVLTKTFHLFGIDEGNEFPFVAQAGGHGGEDALKAPMEHITLLREKARELARAKSAPDAFTSLCAHFSQEVLPVLEASAATAPAQTVTARQVNRIV